MPSNHDLLIKSELEQKFHVEHIGKRGNSWKYYKRETKKHYPRLFERGREEAALDVAGRYPADHLLGYSRAQTAGVWG